MTNKLKISCLTLALFLSACTTVTPTIKMQGGSVNVREEVTWSSHQALPGWYLQPPEVDTRYDYFVGHSVKFSTEPEARDAAMRNAVNQFVRYCGVEVNIFEEYLKITTGKTSSVLAGELSNKERERQQAQAYVTSIKPKEWYLRQVRILHDETPIESGWKASVLVMVPVEEKARVQEYAARKKQKKLATEQKEHQAEINQLKAALLPAVDYYIQAKELLGKNEILPTLRLLTQAEKIINQHKDKPHFSAAKEALRQESGDNAINRAGMLRERLLQGIALIKVDGDGQKISAGQLSRPLTVKAVCSYEGKQIPITPAQIEFKLDGQVIDKTSTDKNGIARLSHYLFDDKYYGQIRVIVGIAAEIPKEAYFNLVIDKPMAKKEEKLAAKVSFIYEDNGVPRQMWDGMSLRSQVDYYSVYFSPEQDSYVYIYQVDSAGVVYQIFPNLEYSNAWNPVKKGKDYWVPNDDRFYLDDVAGEEKIYFFATKEPASDLESLFARLKQANNQQEIASIQGQIKSKLYTRGIGGTDSGNTHPVIAKSGNTFEVISQKLESVGPELMYCLTFRHIEATSAGY